MQGGYRIALALLALGFGMPAQDPGAYEISGSLYKDLPKLDPKRFEVELDNDEVRVIRGKLAGNEASPLHDAGSGVVVGITECHVRLVRLDKRMQYVDVDRGAAQWVHADTHYIRNIVDRPAEFLFIELKDRKPRAAVLHH